MQPGVKGHSASVAHGGSEFYPESLRCLSRARQEKDDCRISTARGPQKREKENKRCLHAFPARRPDREEGKGARAARSRRRVPALESIRSARSIPEADRGGDASSIVTNCLVKEGPYVYKDRPPPPSPPPPFIPPPPLPHPFFPSVPWLAVTRSTTLERHDGRPTEVRSILLRESLACLYI